MHVSHSPTGGLFPPLPFRVPNTLRKETVDIRQRAVAGDEETETFTIRNKPESSRTPLQRQARAKKPANSALVPRTGKSLLASESAVGPAGLQPPTKRLLSKLLCEPSVTRSQPRSARGSGLAVLAQNHCQ